MFYQINIVIIIYSIKLKSGKERNAIPLPDQSNSVFSGTSTGDNLVNLFFDFPLTECKKVPITLEWLQSGCVLHYFETEC